MPLSHSREDFRLLDVMAFALIDDQQNVTAPAPREVRVLQKFRFFTATLAGVLVAITLGLTALTIATAKDGAGPEVFGRHFLVVRSGSMEPAMKTGSLAVARRISPADVSSLDVGEVVVYRSLVDPEMLIMHRIVARTANSRGEVQFVTKGDANVAEDSLLLDASRIVGTVSFSVSRAGYLVAALEQGQLLKLVLLAFVLVSIAVVLSNWANRPELLKENT